MGLRERTPPTPEEYTEYRTRFSNWGRWGDDDEFGTLNFVTPEVRRDAARLVREGRVISCSRPINTHAGPANPYPARHLVAVHDSGEMADFFSMFVHGFSETHLDALCHLATFEGGVTWNGKPLDGYNMPTDRTGTIDFWRDGIVTRGVMYDIPRLRGTACVEPGAPVHGWELTDAAAAQGVEPRAGDAVLIRSGHAAYFAIHGGQPSFLSPAGVHASCVEYLYEHDASMLVWDMQDAPIADQGIPNPRDIPVPLHVHAVVIPYMGMPILDNADFESLARACAELDRWEFQFVVAPLVIPRATGSPVNPLAIL